MSTMYMQSGSFGQQIPIYVRYRILEDSTKEVDTTTTIYAGLPLTLDTTSQKLIPVDAEVKVYGLAKFQKNSYMDEVTGTAPSGIYGSYRGTVVAKGIVDVKTQMIFTISSGAEKTIDLVDTSSGLVPMAPLYVGATGISSGDNTGQHRISAADTTWDANGPFGYVLNYDSAAGIVQILLP